MVVVHGSVHFKREYYRTDLFFDRQFNQWFILPLDKVSKNRTVPLPNLFGVVLYFSPAARPDQSS